MPRKLRPAHLVIGLMSGTSCDGIDAALVSIRGHGLPTRVELRACATFAYPAPVRRLIAQVSSRREARVDRICRANFLLGELFAEAAIAIARQARTPLSRVDLIGSHGQTIHHLPKAASVGGRRVASTLQIGEPSVIAERTGVTTVADFRPRDMACGGQGAPLVPYVDWLLFRHRTRGRLILNIGGIANVTCLPPACQPDQVVAFDTGPGNMLLDALAKRLTKGRQSFDRNGAIALRGSVCGGLLRRLLRHPYLREPPPKSTGRERFGAAFVASFLRQARGLSAADILGTAAAFTAESIQRAFTRFLQPLGPIAEVIASGGGCHNQALMLRLREAFAPVPIRVSDEFGIPVDAKEAIAFAILAHETMAGRPGNLPSATGARRPAVLGKIVPGKRFPWQATRSTRRSPSRRTPPARAST